ncbi:MAG: hypothetical protein ACYS8K_01010, partial [Planctomycetota bacterium]
KNRILCRTSVRAPANPISAPLPLRLPSSPNSAGSDRAFPAGIRFPEPGNVNGRALDDDY